MQVIAAKQVCYSVSLQVQIKNTAACWDTEVQLCPVKPPFYPSVVQTDESHDTLPELRLVYFDSEIKDWITTSRARLPQALTTSPDSCSLHINNVVGR